MKTIAAETTSGRCDLPLPIRFVSDWHLGHPASQVHAIAQVRHLLEGAGTLVMVGDGREELVGKWRPQADRLWEELQQLCRAEDVTFLALTGNHDPDVSEEGWLSLSGGRIFVTHGDMIYDTTSPWSKELFAKRGEVTKLLECRRCDNLLARWQRARDIGVMLRPNCKTAPSLLGYLKLALWPPERLVEIAKVWAGFAKEGDRFLERFAPESEMLICGHFHRPGRFRVGSREVWNTGSLMKMSKGLVLTFDGENVSAETVKLKAVR